MGAEPAHPDKAAEWHEAAAHLVQAHHADPALYVADPPTLPQMFASHARSHEAIASCSELAAEFQHQHEYFPVGSYDPDGLRPFPSVIERGQEREAGQSEREI
ncbi:MAG TPA: hypothetical protein VG253_06635 [Streptosporangiaceae bacterium]|nr:hypothetical protein [Streptosporangiaceae bacterium]